MDAANLPSVALLDQPIPQVPVTDGNFYPEIIIEKTQNPNRFYAFPIIGFLVKSIFLVPLFMEIFFLTAISVFVNLVSPFIILFTGQYWDFAYKVNIGIFIFGLKLSFYFYGLTDKYPGFSLQSNGLFEFKIDKPVKPSRLLAFPLFGTLIRMILLTPYLIFSYIIQSAAMIGGFYLAWMPVLFLGKYPDSIFELIIDSSRMSSAYMLYLQNISDKYPSFKISMNHKWKKIILICLAILFVIINLIFSILFPDNKKAKYYPGNPSTEKLGRELGYQILLPKTLPPGFKYHEYAVFKSTEYRKNRLDTFLSGGSEKEIVISESLPTSPEAVDFFNWFNREYQKDRSPKVAQINQFKGFIYDLPAISEKARASRNLQWFDGTRILMLYAIPKDSFTEEEVISIAKSLYGEIQDFISPTVTIAPLSPTIAGEVPVSEIMQTLSVIIPTVTIPISPNPNPSPTIVSDINFQSAGIKTIEDGVTAWVFSANKVDEVLKIKVKFTNTSSNSKEVKVLRLSLKSQTHGTANKENIFSFILDKGTSRDMDLSYDLIPGSPSYELIYTTEKEGNSVKLGPYVKLIP